MKILVGWDDPAEADLLQLYLTGDQNEVQLSFPERDFLEQAGTEPGTSCS